MTEAFQITLCRMHESPVPAQHQYVLCRVDRSHDIGFYIHLLEWNNTEALLPASSIAQRRIKISIATFVLGRRSLWRLLASTLTEGT